MECSIPPPLTDDQITAALDGAAEPTVQQHLDNCPNCVALLVQARQREHALQSQLQRWDCPPAQQLADYHWGFAVPAGARVIARHLDVCARCRAEVEELRVFLVDERVPQAQPVPPARPTRPFGDAIIAHLLPRAPALALRGTAAEPLIAEAQGTIIVLDAQPTPEGSVLLIGQVVADEQERWNGALVEVRQNNALQTTARLDNWGGWQCGPLHPRPTEIRITPQQGVALVLPDLALAT